MIPNAQFAHLLDPVSLRSLPGFSRNGLLAAWRTLLVSAAALDEHRPPLRSAVSLLVEWRRVLQNLPLDLRDDEDAEAAFLRHFQPFHIGGQQKGFFTAYYEPECEGSMRPTEQFCEPIYAPPENLETFATNAFPLGGNLTSGLRLPEGTLVPVPTRREIESGVLSLRPVLWVRDAVEAFKIHVQGSGRIRLTNGDVVRLTYAGRNGRRYASIGKTLVDAGRLQAEEACADNVYAWVRARGLAPGDPGRELLRANESYIFFRLNADLADAAGPIGGAGASLTPWRSIAIDRNIWPYGLPFWISCDWPSGSGLLQSMVVGQDTGSAILGAARADIFVGSGEAAGRLAGDVRHSGDMFVLLPRTSG